MIEAPATHGSLDASTDVAIVGAGISVYTAFAAFGAVRVMPSIALHPGLWAIPLVIGLAIILYHHHQIRLSLRARANQTAGAAS